ncbi:MAG TPA: DUF4288 domain-containing protein [Bacteroidia bacterium]|nr:DUF4288 domain-containing protein [Bacteroidia bacterium]
MYLAKLIFRIKRNGEADAGTFDEQFRFISAVNTEEAFHKSRRIGKEEDESFTDPRGEKLHWQFVDVTEVYDLNALRDGELLFSGTNQQDEPASYMDYIRQKAMEIQVKNLTFA